MSFSDVEHHIAVFDGCESLLHGDPKSADAQYAFTVLKLHANDQGIYAGQEGFMDTIKKGARSTVKWIKQIIQAIRDYMKGISREDRDRINKIDKILKELKIADYDPTEAYDAMMAPALVIKDKLETLREAAGDVIPGRSPIGASMERVDELIEFLKGDKEWTLYKSIDKLLAELKNTLTRVNSDLEKAVSGKKDDEDLPEETKKLAKLATGLASVVDLVVKFAERWAEQVTSHYSKYERELKSNLDRRDDLQKEKDRLEKKK